MPKRFFNTGYTLIEILVTLTILSIAFSVGYANLRDYSRKQALEGFARQFRSNIRLAQENAIAGKKPEDCSVLDGYKVTFTSSSYSVEPVCSPELATTPVTVSNPLEVVTSPSTNPPTNFTFKALSSGVTFSTGSTSQIITLTQSRTNNSVTITITSGGQIK